MRPAVLLEASRVRFGAGLGARLERLTRQVRSARERGELSARGLAPGAGDEFAGHRPYRPGEDVRHLDLALLARLERPYVRVHRREAGERWLVLLDASGSMGLGLPGKLQAGAELALALAAVGQGFGARVDLLAGRAQGEPLALGYARRQDLTRWLAGLETLEAVRGAPGRAAGLATLLRRAGGGRRRHARVFVLGDLLDVEPAALLGLQRPGRRLHLVQLLAPHELDPGGLGLEAAAWIDREQAARLECALGEPALARYAAALERHLESWRRLSARHGSDWSVWSSATAFEDVVHALLGM